MKYHKKPIIVDAVQFKGYITDELLVLLGLTIDGKVETVETSKFIMTPRVPGVVPTPIILNLITNSGPVYAQDGDWVIKSLVDGEFYPCSNATFESIYIKVTE